MFLRTRTREPEQDYHQFGENGRYWVQMGRTSLTLKATYQHFMAFIDPATLDIKYDDGQSFVITGKIRVNRVPVTLRTRSNHGPTIEFNIRYPQHWREGIIEKYRIGGKLILIHLLFRKVFPDRYQIIIRGKTKNKIKQIKI